MSSKGDRRPAWMSKELLAELRRERSMESGKRGRQLVRSTRLLSEHAGKQGGRVRPTWN